MTLLSTLQDRSADEFEVSVALGYVPGWRMFRKFGHNADIDTGTEDVWGYGGVRILPTTATVASLVSTSANDAAAGTGLRTVVVQGLDTNYIEVEETVTLNGVTPVNTTQVFWRINRIYGLTSGTGATNAGTITCSVNSQVQASIQIGLGQTLVGMFTVPAGHTLIIKSVEIGTGRIGSGDLHFQLQIRYPNGDLNAAPWRVQSFVDIYESFAIDKCCISVPEKTEIRCRATSTTVNLSMGVILCGYLIDNRVLKGG